MLFNGSVWQTLTSGFLVTKILVFWPVQGIEISAVLSIYYAYHFGLLVRK
jgi:hypothetical protein